MVTAVAEQKTSGAGWIDGTCDGKVI
jgi:hypothetical protein